ncbi:hypothetical protein Dret_1822 [Desulfohalobium retbaense DSM 5692]|uniref:Uncharacterized protein n=1 Tax=Desulfohalobium retbaense (strain ATCC 49708 / DSM 5692 / JCM 16813 / HR100) TaxID=485915 RepID=C8X3V9_DESRD|nr:hypothetical protein Dret_1822 [Desulfohalobium retbaense DSM 5692]
MQSAQFPRTTGKPTDHQRTRLRRSAEQIVQPYGWNSARFPGQLLPFP